MFEKQKIKKNYNVSTFIHALKLFEEKYQSSVLVTGGLSFNELIFLRDFVPLNQIDFNELIIFPWFYISHECFSVFFKMDLKLLVNHHLTSYAMPIHAYSDVGRVDTQWVDINFGAILVLPKPVVITKKLAIFIFHCKNLNLDKKFL